MIKRFQEFDVDGNGVLGEYLALAAIDTWRTRVAEVSEIALGALHALAWNPVNKLRLAEVPRGVELVVNAMQHFRSAAQLQTQGIAFFSSKRSDKKSNKRKVASRRPIIKGMPPLGGSACPWYEYGGGRRVQSPHSTANVITI